MRPTAGPSSLRCRAFARGNRIDLIRVKTRQLDSRDRFVAARVADRKEALVKLIEGLNRKCLTKRARIQATAKVGVFAIFNKKPLVNRCKQTLAELPGLFDANLLAEMLDEERFLGPMKKTIIKKVVSSFNKMAQVWSKAAVLNNSVLFDNKPAIPEQHPGAGTSSLLESRSRGDVFCLRVHMVAFSEFPNHQNL